MTVEEALARAEELRPGCQITARTRQRWLVELDGMLREKFFKNCPEGSYDAVGADRAWNDQLAEDAELLPLLMPSTRTTSVPGSTPLWARRPAMPGSSPNITRWPQSWPSG